MATKARERVERPSGEAGQQATGGNGAEPLSPELLKRLYSYMLKCRTVEERARVLFKQGKFAGNYYAAVGQEATEVGCSIDLEEPDCIGPSHRDFISQFMKVTPLKFMFAQL